jgi:hypothetical protein
MKSVKKPGKKSTPEKHLKRDYLRLSPHDAHHPLLLPFLLHATHVVNVADDEVRVNK